MTLCPPSPGTAQYIIFDIVIKNSKLKASRSYNGHFDFPFFITYLV